MKKRTDNDLRGGDLFDEVLRMVLQGEILDSMTIIAVLHAAHLRAL